MPFAIEKEVLSIGAHLREEVAWRGGNVGSAFTMVCGPNRYVAIGVGDDGGASINQGADNLFAVHTKELTAEGPHSCRMGVAESESGPQ